RSKSADLAFTDLSLACGHLPSAVLPARHRTHLEPIVRRPPLPTLSARPPAASWGSTAKTRPSAISLLSRAHKPGRVTGHPREHPQPVPPPPHRSGLEVADARNPCLRRRCGDIAPH